MTDVAKVVELVASSKVGWEDAAKNACIQAQKSIKGATGIEVNDMTGKLDHTGTITEYRVGVKLVYGMEEESS